MNKNTIINTKLSFNGKAFSVNLFALYIFVTLLIFLSACGSDNMEEEKNSPAPNVTMGLRAGMDPVFLNNTWIYVFTNQDKFVEKKKNVSVNSSGDKLSTYMPVGVWNLALVTCNTNISKNIIHPPYGGASSYPMWRTGFTDQTGDFLAQTPAELRYDSLKNTVIVENLRTSKQAILNRNVAKIQVVLKKYTGFDPISPGKNNDAFIELLNVPTTLDWRGRYYPGKDNPEMSAKPIREYLNFKYNAINELEADTIDFIVPAHRGTDAFGTVRNDTTKHKLSLKASMPLKGQSYFGKTPFEIPFVPKINSIIQIILTFRGEPETGLDVKVTVKDWEDPIDQEEIF